MADDYDIGEAFDAIEKQLIQSMIRNFKHHRLEEIKEDKQWTMWQAEQLKELELYRKKNQKRFKKEFSRIHDHVDELLRMARETGGMEQEQKILEAIEKGFKGYKRADSKLQAAFFRVNDRKLEALIKATTDDFEKAEVAILRMANDQYRKIIFNAQVYANTGAGTYEQAVDMATHDMLASGLNCVEYANGSRHRIGDYARMAIRTASKRAYLTGEGEKRKEWGIPTVIVNKRGNPCPKCLPFCGKVFIDDVWSGGEPEKKHAEEGISPGTGIRYPLISLAVEAGLYHPNCRDSHTTYFEGINRAPEGSQYTREELNQIAAQYAAEQKQNYAKKQVEKFGRLKSGSLDKENRERYSAKEREWKGLASGGDGVITPMTTPKFVEKIDVTDWRLVESKIREYEKLIRDALEEHIYVILQNGKVYHFVGGRNGVNPKKLGDALVGSIMTHNHPVNSNNEYSFSKEDFDLMEECQLKRLRGVDELFNYELSAEYDEVEPMATTVFQIGEYDGRHEFVKIEAKEHGYGYRRERRDE